MFFEDCVRTEGDPTSEGLYKVLELVVPELFRFIKFPLRPPDPEILRSEVENREKKYVTLNSSAQRTDKAIDLRSIVPERGHVEDLKTVKTSEPPQRVWPHEAAKIDQFFLRK